MRAARRLLTTLVLLTGAAAARADEALSTAEARYAREQLLAEARRSANADTGPHESDLEAARAAILADRLLASNAVAAGAPRDALAALDATLAVRAVFLGRSTKIPNGATGWDGGALFAARRLDRWLAGQEPGDVRVVPEGEPPPADGAAVIHTWQPPGRPAGSAGPGEPAAAVAGTLDEWATAVRKKVGGSLLRCRIEAVPFAPIDDLLAAARPLPAYLPKESWAPARHAMVDPAGPGAAAGGVEWNEPALRLRALQSAERVEAMSKEVPTEGLVDEATVREKIRRAADLAEEADRLAARRAAVLAELDRMATASADGWRTVLGTLAVQIEERKRGSASPPAPAPPAAPEPGPSPGAPPAPPVVPGPVDVVAELRLRVLEAQESTALVDLRYLFLAAVRADLRIRALDRLAALVGNETLAAKGAATRFGDELARVRRERQLARLEFERAGRLERDRRDVDAELASEAAAVVPGTPQSGRVETARVFRDVVEALLGVNDVVLDAVKRRQASTERSTPAAPAAPSPDAKVAAAAAADPLAGLRSPETSWMDAAYVDAALDHLADPTLEGAFDAELVARHFTVADQRLAGVRAALASIAEPGTLEVRYRAAEGDAKSRLQRLAALPDARARYLARQYRDKLESHRVDFDDAIKGLVADRERMVAREVVLERYRAALLGAGRRAFKIRVRRDLSGDALAQAASDVSSAAHDATAFATFDGEAHLGTFAAAHWEALLGLVAAAVAGAFVVARGRQWLSARIDRLVAEMPSLSHRGASPAEEKVEAKENVERHEAAARTAEESVLRQAAGESAEPAPPASGESGPLPPVTPGRAP